MPPAAFDALNHEVLRFDEIAQLRNPQSVRVGEALDEQSPWQRIRARLVGYLADDRGEKATSKA
jgi:hypothetical protein